ncbi:MAG: polysaccharide ABC transporter ATP-binding protein [Microscillaceae bacterium]|nr:polysaccharide ABC transporter ATP-binding protein [Microscillaceae bacterium]MDW8461406.1 polysaccharide ABC transporter ATP-binding protein [Cytophagales bacterium]
MPDVVISVENIWKRYKLGNVSIYTLRDDIAHWWAKLHGKENPIQKIVQENDLTQKQGEYVWALQDVCFEVRRGEVLGIIGKNGAGKSTLLKILSKITQPTRGQVKIKGRIASLLEVGTGFHPELTGRENIFLNGAILGLTKAEIKQKLDEIIAFSGIEAYIDTPVKRYSSGMYVRLAFAVAAHLEPEILIVDEVLAVGDAEFQKKCLGKMQDVSSTGRTVILVSHNLNVINSLCTQILYLAHGQVKVISKEVEQVIHFYKSQMLLGLDLSKDNTLHVLSPEAKYLELISVDIFLEDSPLPSQIVQVGKDFYIKIIFSCKYKINLQIGIKLFLLDGTLILATANWLEAHEQLLEQGKYEIQCWISPNVLNEGKYYLDLIFIQNIYREIARKPKALFFEIIDNTEVRKIYPQKWGGYVREITTWQPYVLLNDVL